MKRPAASCGVSLAEFHRSLPRLRSYELRRGRFATICCSKPQTALAKANGAGNGIRTRDPQLGRLTL